MVTKMVLDCSSVEDFLSLFHERYENFTNEGIWSKNCINLLAITWTEDIIKFGRFDDNEKIRRIHYLTIARNQFDRLPV